MGLNSPRQQNPDLPLQTALLLHREGKLEEAVNCYREILTQQPGNADALHLLGTATAQLGKTQEAATFLLSAIGASPQTTAYWHSLGQLYSNSQDWKKALQCYRQITEIDSHDSRAFFELGRMAHFEKNYPLAVGSLQTSLKLNSEFPDAYCELGKVMNSLGDGATAEQFFSLALALNPESIEAQCNLGNALRKQGKLEAAISIYQQFLARYYEERQRAKDSIYWQVKNNLALSLHELGNSAAAIAHYEEVLEHDPENALLHTNLAYVLLSSGRMLDGWKEHEWRWKMKGFSTAKRNFGCPQWLGEDLSGKTILLHCEQGMGDTLQFSRYAPLVATHGAKVIVEVQQPLRRLLKNLTGVSSVISRGEPLPQVDYHCPLMSLPLAFRTTEGTIPKKAPYLTVQSEDILALKQRWSSPKLRVGVAWAGNKIHPNDKYRSCRLQDFIPLAELNNVTFYSLQVGEATQQIVEAASLVPILDACSSAKDFYDTAALLAGLDLVISVDSAVAHLAGALNIPVWIMLPQSRNDWRWSLGEAKTPWYPSATLFRQVSLGDWSSVIDAIKKRLQELPFTRSKG